MEHQAPLGRDILNFYYTLFYKIYCRNNGSQLIFLQSFSLFLLISVGSISNLCLFFLVNDFRTRFLIGFFILLLIMLRHFFFVGFQFNDEVEKYSRKKTFLIMIFSCLLSLTLFAISVYIEVMSLIKL
jgi:small-conductance mechanosensitive channel